MCGVDTKPYKLRSFLLHSTAAGSTIPLGAPPPSLPLFPLRCSHCHMLCADRSDPSPEVLEPANSVVVHGHLFLTMLPLSPCACLLAHALSLPACLLAHALSLPASCILQCQELFFVFACSLLCDHFACSCQACPRCSLPLPCEGLQVKGHCIVIFLH